MAEIKNPNQQGGGGQDSRSILVMTAIFVVVFLGVQYLMPKKPSQPTPQQQQQQQQQQAPTPPTESNAASNPAASHAASAGTVQAAAESTTVVENELYRIQFTNRGAQVKSWILKKYKDDAGKSLDLVNSQTAARFGYPLSVYTYDAGLRDRLSQAMFVPSATGNLASPGTLSFEYSGDGLTVRKTFRFDSSYVIHADVEATRNGATLPAFLAWPASFGDEDSLPSYSKSHLDLMQNGKDSQEAPKKTAGGATLQGPFDYAGVSDLYFAAIFLPDAPQQTSVVSLHNEIWIPKNPKKPDPNQTERVDVLGAAVGDTSGHTSLRIYAGPKSLDVLRTVHATGPDGKPTGPNIDAVVSFGWSGVISKPLFIVLRWVHSHVVSNWGWAILVLTLIINLGMLPTRIQMMKSALKMQRIQPQMEAIKEKYKKYKTTDPRRQEMNKEIFDLQKREGANMFGGCLPMLIQWPLLYGFYSMLSNVIELRQAHWLWLPDLSAPDPLHILPIFFVISMFLVQFLTPSPGVDPAQQRMMAFTMPAVFGFMTWNVGSGLALYWAMGNIIGVIQQIVMNRTSMGKEMQAIAARRAAKRLGKPAPARR